MINEEMRVKLEEQFAISLPTSISEETLRQIISDHINYLITHNLNSLYAILYRVDVSEKKLKELLETNSDEDAGKLIAGLIIERQLQKIRSRSENRGDKKINEDEGW